MMKDLLFQQQQSALEENMSNLTSASGDQPSVSSGNKTEITQHYFTLAQQPPQSQPSAKRKRNLPGNPDPDAEVIALSPKTLLATNRFICEICNKGFQRDQNLQLHRRGHNLPWKLKTRTNKEVIRKKVYVCPEASCVHHEPSRALGDLTGIKKHFSRKHGEKKWKCDKCSNRYAVQSDWKAHSKTCGTREYRCDCGTLFSRRDSFITHRAFCDALAEESARAITNTPNPLLSSSSNSISPFNNTNIIPNSQFNPQNLPISFPNLKKELLQNNSFINNNPMAQIPPWLSSPAPPPPNSSLDHHPHHLSSSSSSPSIISIFSNSNSNPNVNMGHTLPPYQPVPSPHMSATALLQKAAQMGATMSSSNNTKGCRTTTTADHIVSQPSILMGVRDHNQQESHVFADSSAAANCEFGLNLSSRDQEMGRDSSSVVDGLTSNFGNKAAVAAACGSGSAASGGGGGGVLSGSFHEFVNSLSSSASGFDGSSFDIDAFGGILSSKKDGSFLNSLLKTTTCDDGCGGSGGGGGGEDLTRDFLGLKAFSHSDFLNIAGFGNCNNINTSSQSHQYQNQRNWHG